MSEDKYCKFEKYQRWVSYDSGITWSPMDEYQKGELIERDSVDCGWEPTPPTPEVEYRWVDIPLENDFYCSGTTKYYKQKMQQSEDSGTTWTDVVPPQYRMGASAQSESSDCGYASRTTSGSPYCDDGNKVVMIYYQVSDDHGASWTTTSSTENIIEYDVAECGYATRTTSGSPYCVGVDKCVDLYHQVTRDGGTTWTTTSTTVSVIEYNSEDCGYVPHDYSKDYFTIVALEDSTIKFINVGGLIEYSLDSGETWDSFYAYQGKTISVQSGHTAMLKGTLVRNACPANYSLTITSGAFDVEGNLMSLLYGDDFEDKLSLINPNGFKFYSLFNSSTSLRNAENMILPATTLTSSCYRYMFMGCTSLTRAPKVLPAATLEEGCYFNMFSGCTSLTTAPELPATALAKYCYQGMFHGCTSLTTAPSILPARTLADGCYRSMFEGCTSLTTAPPIIAERIVGYGPNAYGDTQCLNMFEYCSSLSAITCLATNINISESYGTQMWVWGVSPTGIFVKEPLMNGWPRGADGIPNGWTVIDAPSRAISGTPYCSGTTKVVDVFGQISINSGTSWITTSSTISVVEYDSADCGYADRWVDIPLTEDYYCSGTTKYYKQKMQQSEDSGSTWSDVVPAQYRMGESAETQSSDCGYAAREISGTPYCSGSRKVVDVYHQESEDSGTTWTTTSTTVSVVEYDSVDCGYDLEGDYLTFKVWSAGDSFKFSNAISYSLDGGVTWNQLPANTSTPQLQIGDIIKWKGNLTPSQGSGIGTFSTFASFNVYGNIMSLLFGDNFSGQTSLSGYDYAFYGLFEGCEVQLANNLILPATTLAPYCYANMFLYCSILAYAPKLPAPTLVEGCYHQMFSYCDQMNYIECLATNPSWQYSYSWLSGVSPTGTFIKDANTTWPSGANGIPQNWSVQDAT